MARRFGVVSRRVRSAVDLRSFIGCRHISIDEATGLRQDFGRGEAVDGIASAGSAYRIRDQRNRRSLFQERVRSSCCANPAASSEFCWGLFAAR